MKKCLLYLLLLLIGSAAMAQPKKSVVKLLRSDKSIGIKRDGKDLLKVYNGVFQQDYSTLRSDSAYFYPSDNAFDAFGNVNISQGDTLNIFSDKLNYNGNTKTAILTDNVKMVDRDATLTTNYLTYNTATRIGTYTGGGKLINKDNTLTSKNGYYFANSRDAYFRYDVVLNTIDALVKTDTMRYSTSSRIAYFYGPSNIYGKAKDKDTLYTEFGTYNTVNEQAAFSKNNEYRQGTKSLKGDSLFYDRLKGFGRAVKHITFDDKEQKITLKGDLGTYYKQQERAVVTENAYVILVTEQKDTTATNTPAPKTDSAKLVKTDSVAKKPVTKQPEVKKPVTTKQPEIKTATNTATKKPAVTKVKKPAAKPAVIDTVTSTIIINDKGERIRVDSIYMSADTLETQMIVYKNLKQLQELRQRANIIDSAAVASSAESRLLVAAIPKSILDTVSYFHRDIFKPKPKPQPKAVQLPKTDSLNTDSGKVKTDSLKTLPPIGDKVDALTAPIKSKLTDTSRVRIVLAYHDARIFKSDLQAKADSIFYTTADSTIRCFVKPMMWTQGSQLSGDTIFLQMKNKKMDNMDVFLNSFIVNVEKKDSAHFNQMGGKRMKGYFKDNKLNTMYVDGNAESIYFERDSASNNIKGMIRSLSSRMRIRFEDNKPLDVFSVLKPSNRYGPIDKFTEEDRSLKGFIWRPKDRPASKQEVISSARRKAASRAAARAAAAAPKNPVKTGSKTDSLSTPANKRTTADTSSKNSALKMKATPTGKSDSVINVVPGNAEDVNRNRVQDGTLNTAPVIMPAVIQRKDTANVQPAAPPRRDSTLKQK